MSTTIYNRYDSSIYICTILEYTGIAYLHTYTDERKSLSCVSLSSQPHAHPSLSHFKQGSSVLDTQPASAQTDGCTWVYPQVTAAVPNWHQAQSPAIKFSSHFQPPAQSMQSNSFSSLVSNAQRNVHNPLYSSPVTTLKK